MIIEPGMTLTTKEIKDRGRIESKKICDIYHNKPKFRSNLRGWMANPAVQNQTDASATIAREAATAAAAAAEEARRIVSAISPTAPIFEAINEAAEEAATAAREAAHNVDVADESFDVSAAQFAARRAVIARDMAIAAVDEIRRTIADSPSAPAAAASSSSSNP
jgi:hypothetical protein